MLVVCKTATRGAILLTYYAIVKQIEPKNDNYPLSF